MEGLTTYDELLLDRLRESPLPEDGIIPIGTKRWAKELHVDDTRLRNALRHLERLGYLHIEMRGCKIYGARPAGGGFASERKENESMAHVDKPIMSQPNGTGKLFSRKGDGAWEGTYQRPDGKTDRKRFRAANTMKVKELYADWCRENDEILEREMRERVKPKNRNQATVKQTSGGMTAKPVVLGEKTNERKEQPMENKKEAVGNVYVIQVVGGAGIAWTESFDKTAAVCDALTEAAKASGFAAKYDVVEVKKWIA